jgi:uncharacterized LabA/DUF88 family protein
VDRCVLFVDAGYVLADGAMAVHGTRRRESVSWDYAGLLQLFGSLAMERSRLPLLRCYWYEATVEGQRTADHETLADLPGVKLRVAKARPGRREGVESEIRRDLTTLARNKAVSDVVMVSAEEDLAQVIADVQDMGLRVTLLHIDLEGSWAASRSLRQECDDVVEISAGHLRPYVELISGAEPPRPDESDAGPIALRPAMNGNGHHVSSANGKLPATGRVVAYAPQSRPEPGQQPGDAVPAPGTAQPDQGQPQRPDAAMVADFSAVPDLNASVDYSASVDYGVPADYPPVADHRAAADQGPAAEYGTALDYGPADYAPAPAPDYPAAPMPASQQDIYAAPVAFPVSPGNVGAGSAQIRRLPTRDAAPVGPPGVPAPASTPPAPPPPTAAEVVMARQPGAQQAGGQPLGGQFQGGQFQGGQFQAGQFQGGQFQSGQQPSGQPTGGQPTGGQPTGGQPVLPYVPPAAMRPGVPGGQVPALAAPVPGGQQDLVVSSGPLGLVSPGGYPGGAPGVSLGDAVQSAHEEGQAFGESVARDAPALWLEAVIARKPRMPSDLEARLLQGSALPIDFLLHDEVRHALRRGFWDALERARR